MCWTKPISCRFCNSRVFIQCNTIITSIKFHIRNTCTSFKSFISTITAITTYFTPIKSELSGSYNTYINEYTDLRDLIYDLSNTNYTIDLLQKSIDEAIKSWQEQLKYTE